MPPWTTLRELRPGAIFKNRAGEPVLTLEATP
jgi:hypothetical protein